MINESAGGVAHAEDMLADLEPRLGQVYEQVELVRGKPDEWMGRLEHLADTEPTLVVVGGGDGTIRGAVRCLAGTQHALGLLPVGTMNRFARALGVPVNIHDAIATLLEGEPRAINLGEADGHLFLNTCFVGAYAQIAGQREARRAGHPHWPRFIRWVVDTVAAAADVARHWRLLRFRFHIAKGSAGRKVATILVGNDPLKVIPDDDPEGQSLTLYIPRSRGPIATLWVLLRAAVVGKDATEGLETIPVNQALLTMRPAVPAALDGEVRFSRTAELRLRSRVGAVRVVLPAPGSAPEEATR